MKPKIFIASFAFGGSIPIQTASSLFATVADLNSNGIEAMLDLRPGGPYVQKERNLSVARFMDSDATHLLFVDADLAFEPSAARAMLAKDKSVIGGLYRYKMEKEAFPCQLLVQEEGPNKGEYYEKDGLFLAAGLPTGFLMIKREVIAAMIENFPETRYELRESANQKVIMTLHNLFDCVLHNGQWWGEDYVFCKRWLAMGGELWAYPDIPFAHIGTFGYIGNFQEFYQNNLEQHRAVNIAEMEAQDESN